MWDYNFDYSARNIVVNIFLLAIWILINNEVVEHCLLAALPCTQFNIGRAESTLSYVTIIFLIIINNERSYRCLAVESGMVFFGGRPLKYYTAIYRAYSVCVFTAMSGIRYGSPFW